MLAYEPNLLPPLSLQGLVLALVTIAFTLVQTSGWMLLLDSLHCSMS